MDDALDYLPLSYLNQIAYCTRRFWLMFVENQMPINAAVFDGIQKHRHAHDEGGEVTLRHVYIWSDALRVSGYADFVEDRGGILVPVEQKRGRMGRWLNDHVQVCAQAICLEERTGQEVPTGEIFYWGNRRRERVALTPALRARTAEIAEMAFGLLARGERPGPIDHYPKCRDCSLEPVCLPREVRKLRGEA